MARVFSDVLRERAASLPDEVAILDELGATTNAQLDQSADQVAAQVLDLGVDRIAVIASNSERYLVHAFGVWRAGKTLVTVYPSSSPTEIAYALEHSQVELVFADDECVPRVPDGYEVYAIERSLEPADGFAGPHVDPSTLALICYTSGSTQRPKAVMHSHASILSGAEAYARVWHLGPDDTTLVVLPMAWVFGLVTASMATLCGGGRVRSSRRARPSAMMSAFRDDHATFFIGVTTIFAKLVEALSAGDSIDGHRIRLCIAGGEPRNEVVFDEWTRHTGVPVHDVYAASECFPVVTYDPEEDSAPTPGCAGRVVPGSTLRLWDEEKSSWIDGPGIGEAFVRGSAFFAGYEGDPEATEKALSEPGWYRTGDMVQLQDDGLVRVLGRLSGMIIRGGANVAPAEIERVVREVDTVDDAVALGLADSAYGQRIVVVVTAAAAVLPEADVIIGRCRAELAGYKVPQEVIVVDEFPLNERTGKIDRRALQERIEETLS